MKYLSVFLIFIMLFSCKKEDENLDLKYEVLNHIISNEENNLDKNNGMNHVYNIKVIKVSFPENKQIENNLEKPPPGLSMIINYDKDFLETDSLFYKTQAEGLQDFKFEKSKLKKKIKVITSQEIENIYKTHFRNFWIEFDKRYPNTCIKTISVPFFNKEKNICIVKVSESCGSLWGGGFTGIYKKVNGTWIKVDSFDHWVS